MFSAKPPARAVLLLTRASVLFTHVLRRFFSMTVKSFAQGVIVLFGLAMVMTIASGPYAQNHARILSTRMMSCTYTQKEEPVLWGLFHMRVTASTCPDAD
jgi:hypothetical protein